MRGLEALCGNAPAKRASRRGGACPTPISWPVRRSAARRPWPPSWPGPWCAPGGTSRPAAGAPTAARPQAAYTRTSSGWAGRGRACPSPRSGAEGGRLRPPNEAPRKVYILENAQELNESAQNALLKLLEEGPAYACFLFLTDNAGAILPTVRSRCELLSLSPVSPAEAESWLLSRYPQLPPRAGPGGRPPVRGRPGPGGGLAGGGR